MFLNFHLNTQREYTTTQRTFMGRDYLVAPVVAAQQQVMNGELITADELGVYVDAWNNIPLPLSHPQVNGLFVSANTPEVIEAYSAGMFFNAHMDGDRLAGEIWVDIVRAGELESIGGLRLLQRLQAGEPIQVSTAYWRDLEETAGVYGGVAYYGIARNMRPDHLAILLDEEGACNWVDGCGVRANSDPVLYPTDTAREAALAGLKRANKIIDSIGAGWQSSADFTECDLSIAVNIANGAGVPQGVIDQIAPHMGTVKEGDLSSNDQNNIKYLLYGGNGTRLAVNKGADMAKKDKKQGAGDEAANGDAPQYITNDHKLTTNAHDGVMVGFFVAPEDAQALQLTDSILPQGSAVVPAQELHLTLAYLGKIDEVDIDLTALLDGIANFADQSTVLQGEIGGIGRFATMDTVGEQENMTPYVALYDSPALEGWRTYLINFLRHWLEQPAKRTHGFCPHVTLAYLPSDQDTPAYMPERRALNFKRLSVAWGGTVYTFPLRGDITEAQMAENMKQQPAPTKEDQVMATQTNNDQDLDKPVDNPVTPEGSGGADAGAQVDDQPTDGGADAGAQSPTPPPVDWQAQIGQIVGTAVDAAIAPYKEALTAVAANAKTERQRLVEVVVANTGFTAEDCKTITTDALRRVAERYTAIPTPNYLGQVVNSAQTPQQPQLQQAPMPEINWAKKPGKAE